MNRTWSFFMPSRGYSTAIGSLTPRIMSDEAQMSSGSSMIWAPVAMKSASGIDDPTPASFSTYTVCPAAVSSRTPAGVMATRYSSAFTSLGTPTIIGTSSLHFVGLHGRA